MRSNRVSIPSKLLAVSRGFAVPLLGPLLEEDLVASPHHNNSYQNGRREQKRTEEDEEHEIGYEPRQTPVTRIRCSDGCQEDQHGSL